MKRTLSRRRALALGAAAAIAPRFAARAAEESSGKTRLGFIGVGDRGTYLLRRFLELPETTVTAICDIDESHQDRAIKMVIDERGTRPSGHSRGPFDYRRLLERDDVDAVVIATPMPLHARMAIDALRAGRHAYSEVSAAMTLDECWELVEAEEKSGRVYMLGENCCYYRHIMMIANMVRQGVFGGFTYAECGYVHDCRSIKFKGDGSLTWRGEMGRDHIGNLYPTHSLGPVAQWLGINRGDRLVSLVSMTTRRASIRNYAVRRFGKDHPAANIDFAAGDSTSTLIRTAKGVVIDLRYDTASARPHPSTTYQALQGEKASYESDGDKIWMDGRTKGYSWERASNYAGEFDDPMWKKWIGEARQAGHGGGDFFVIREFVKAVRAGGPSPIGAVDAATWSCITPLSAQSIRTGSQPVDVPDFSRGRWKAQET